MKVSIKRILEEMPENLEDIEKVRYLYLKLGEILSYNRDYLYVPDFTVEQNMYEDYVTIGTIENKDYENKVKVVCKQMADLLKESVNTLSQKNIRIKAKTIGYVLGEANHVATLTTIGEKNYLMDLSRDIYRIQKGLKTKYFGRDKRFWEKLFERKYDNIEKDLFDIELDEIPQEEIEKMDDKLGYSINGIYMDDVFIKLKEEMDNSENWRQLGKNYDEVNSSKDKTKIIAKWKLEFILKYMKNSIQEENKMGIIELDKFYNQAVKKILTDEERKTIKSQKYDINLKEDNENKKSIIYELDDGNKKDYYVYSDNQRGFIPTTEEEIKVKSKKGDINYESEYLIPDFEKEEERG